MAGFPPGWSQGGGGYWQGGALHSIGGCLCPAAGSQSDPARAELS